MYPPAWCPKRKSPAEYRVYAYKGSDTWLLHYMLRVKGLKDTPRGSEFAVRVEGKTDLTAREVWKEAEHKTISEILGISIHEGEVIEIDDGLRPYFFLVAKNLHLQMLINFQSDMARENEYIACDNTSVGPAGHQ